jgi:isopentenyl-diphosphate delta-isomerase
MKIQIVDKQDRLIGAKEYSEVSDKADIYRVSGLWLTNSKGQTLLAQRASTKRNDPSKWGPAVMGTIEEGETYESNIYKEAKEEIGLEGVQFTKGVKMYLTYPGNHFDQWYLVTLDRDIKDFVRQSAEVDALEWVDVKRLKQELKASPDKYIGLMAQIVEELGI